ncbi:acyl-CoA transferase [Oleisolibacter albus]|uniref:acyl-CoA transferase n=1 Tax=Oleisolibacter albus TaxID=2171757 RepID=UPI000DF3ECF5|nr:acyl-CoA transferase [Oleisolibacter albus]
MPSIRETALSALLVRLAAVPNATAGREIAVPERIPPGGLLILRDGVPGEPEVTLSPLLYHYDHIAEIEALVQAADPPLGRPGSGRARALDDLLRALAASLAADRTLGGTVDWLAWGAPETEDIAVAGGAAIKAARVPVTLTYSTPDPLT